MRRKNYVGPWACVACGMQLWASALDRDGWHSRRCHACSKGRIVPERRTERRPWMRERRKAYTVTL